LLSVGFRNVIQARRTAYRTLRSEINKFDGEQVEKNKSAIDEG